MTNPTGLAERLRQRAAAPGVGVKQSKDMQAAADALDAKDAEIARLKAELQKLRARDAINRANS